MYRNSIFILLFFSTFLKAQEMPLGFVKYFEASFTQEKLEEQFLTSSHTSTKLKDGILFTEEKTDTTLSFMPPAILLVENHVLGDFIADININVTKENTDSLSGLFVITGLRDSSNYYFIQLCSKGALFYKMYRGKVSLIDSDSTFAIKDQAWQNMRITRDILKRTIHIKSGKYTAKFSDPNLIMGYMGLGTSRYKLALKSMVIWAPTAISRPASVFR